MISLSRRRDLGLEQIASLAPQEVGRALTRVAARAWEPIAFALSLEGPGTTHHQMHAMPRDLRPGSAERGREIMKGRFALGGAVLEMPRSQPWTVLQPSAPEFGEALHSFSWLADLGALDRSRLGVSGAARESARALVAGWIKANMSFSEPAWRPDIVGRRMMCWLSEMRLLSDGSDLTWRNTLQASLSGQTRYLYHTSAYAAPGLPRLSAHMGLLLSCLALGDAGPRRDKAIERLIPELKAQLLPDGGHVSRAPAAQLDLVADLLLLKEAFDQSNTPLPPELLKIINAGSQLLAMLDLGNGALAFSSTETNASAVLDATSCSHWPNSAPQSGYQRLDSNGTLVLVSSAPRAKDPLSFELASNKQRIVTCGRSAKLSTAELRSDLGWRTDIVRHEDQNAGQGGIWLELMHEGYGLIGRRIHRQLYLKEGGGDFRGEDRIESLPGTQALAAPFEVRFQLHRDVSVEQHGIGVLLGLPNGELWRFKSKGADFELGEPKIHGREMLLHGVAGGDPLSIRWAFKREAGDWTGR